MKVYIIIVGLLFPLFLSSQNIIGKVTNDKQEPLIGASVHWLNTTVGTSTDQNGDFEISLINSFNKKLIASYIGFASDTIEVSNETSLAFKLIETAVIEVTVKGQRDGIVVSNLNPIKTEQITKTELGKSACCDLAGCFATQSSVQPQTTNVITNSKELRILGLSGVYNQVLINGLPMINGLSYTYGISSIPGTVVENIFISKGANSVLQGYESISGQINVITKEADNTDKLFLNTYINSFQEKHLNANVAFKLGEWSNLISLHSVLPATKIDRDQDNFLDLPLLTRYAVSNTLKYGNDGEWGWHSRIGLRFLDEKRIGGQELFDANSDEGSTKIYGNSVKLYQPEIWTKSGYRVDDVHHFVLLASAYYQDQESYFGPVKYQANQSNFYGNFQYEFSYQGHVLKTGASLRSIKMDEDISFTNNTLSRTYDGSYNKHEVIPGLFAENTMQFFNQKLTWIAGIRSDYHNDFGNIFTPRTLLKYDISPLSVIRANIGTGWRTTNLFSENINLLVSSRDVIIEENLLPEQAINYGINYIHKIEAIGLSGYISADYYHTDFQNQIFPDYDSDPTKAIIKNYQGTSIGNGFQLDLVLRFREEIEFKTGYNYLDVFRGEGETKQQLPFNSKHKALVAFSYKPMSNKYHFDVNTHWLGKQRLPNTSSNPIEFQRPDFSESYAVVNAQFTYRFKKIEAYIGCENIFDYRQKQPILGWQNPFGPYFDTSSVWGPTRGREIYIGARYYLKDKT